MASRPIDLTPETAGSDPADLDMTWIVIAVLGRGRGAVVLDYSAGWHGFLDWLHVDDMFDQMPIDTPAEPGAYRWTGYKIGSWDDGDAIVVRGGTFAPHVILPGAGSATGDAPPPSSVSL